jgi:pimeloyl-ACP methyl ester carboxylesterase
MRAPIDLRIDVTEASGLGESAHCAVTVFVPDSVPERADDRSAPVVAFAWPGAGYGRRYFAFDMPGSSFGGQAGHHADRDGWIFVACDHLGAGDSSIPDLERLTLEVVTAANGAVVDQVSDLLASGALAPDLPPIVDPLRVGMGQSMGGCFTVALQGTAPRFDAVAVLGFSAIHTVMPRPSPTSSTSDAATDDTVDAQISTDALRWAFYSADVPDDIVAADLTDFPTRGGNLPPWGSATAPGAALRMREPGVVAREAAAIDVPVFLATGEIDGVPDPRAEPGAYARSRDITVYVQPQMAHMHNFAGSRTVLWDRLAAWVAGIRRPPAGWD